MKKIIFLFVTLLTFAPAMAQNDGFDFPGESMSGDFGKPKKHAFFIGPKVGLVAASISDPKEGKLADGMGVGFSAGAAMKLRFGKATSSSKEGTGFFGVGLELKYKQSNAKTIGIDQDGKENAKLGVSYFDIPVFVQVYPFAKSKAMNTFYIEVGPDFALAVGRSPKSLRAGEYQYVTEKMTAHDLKFMAGIGYTIPKTGLDINFRYFLGTSKMAKNFESKMSNLEVSLAWMFKAGKF